MAEGRKRERVEGRKGKRVEGGMNKTVFNHSYHIHHLSYLIMYSLVYCIIIIIIIIDIIYLLFTCLKSLLFVQSALHCIHGMNVLSGKGIIWFLKPVYSLSFLIILKDTAELLVVLCS